MAWGCLQFVFHVVDQTGGYIKLPHFGLSDLPSHGPQSGHNKTRETSKWFQKFATIKKGIRIGIANALEFISIL